MSTQQGIRQLMHQYPSAREAILYIEGIVCIGEGKDGGKSGWDLIMEQCNPSLTPQEAFSVLRDVIASEVDDPETDPKMQRAAARALSAMDHPEFMTYLRGKMGMM